MTFEAEKPLWQYTAGELGKAYRQGQLKPSQVIQAVLVRAEEVDPVLNLFAVLDAEGASKAALESDARFAAQEPLGDFDGVPITIKDNIPVKGLQLAWGSNLYKGQIAQDDETPVERLRAQGAIILGKTNVSEFTLGRGNVNTLAFGVTRNPYDPTLTSGASTGGGAAATAAGIGTIAIGTDGGGSIRRPASYNNLVGLKPSTGRVARVNGLPPILGDFEIIGPLSRTVDDLALALSAIEGPDSHDRASYGFSKGGIEPVPRGQKVLFVRDVAGMAVEEPIAASVAEVAENLSALGFVVEEGPAPFDASLFEKHWPVMGATGLAWLLKDTDWEGKVGAPYPPMIEKGRSLTAVEFFDALMAYRAIYEQFSRTFDTYDLVLTPAAGAMPWKAEEFAPPYHRAFTGFVNAAGLPAISIPASPSSNGMPIGFQLIAPFGADWSLVSIAKLYEETHPWIQNAPAI